MLLAELKLNKQDGRHKKIVDASIYIVYTVIEEGDFDADNDSKMGQQPGYQDS